MKKRVVAIFGLLLLAAVILTTRQVAPAQAGSPAELFWRSGDSYLRLITAEPDQIQVAYDDTTRAVTLTGAASLTISGHVAGPVTINLVGQDHTLTLDRLTATHLTATAPLIAVVDSHLQATSLTLLAEQQLRLQCSRLDLSGDANLQAPTIEIRDSAASPMLIAAGGTLTLQADQTLDIFALAHPTSALSSGGDMTLRSANPVRGDAHYRAGGHFAIERLDGRVGDLVSPYDPIILADEGVSLGDYSGASLHIIAGSSVVLNSAVITGTDTAANTINPANATVINGGGLTLGDLATVPLSNGGALTVDGSLTPTLDIRAGVDWLALGGSPTNQTIPSGSVPAAFNPATSAAITITGGITISPPAGAVLLTNQFQPNGLSGGITVGSVNAGTSQPNSDGGTIVIDSRGDLSAGTVSAAVEVTGTGVIAGNGGQVTLLAPAGSLTSGDVTAHTRIPGNQSGTVGDGGAIVLAAAGDLTIDGGSGSVSTFAFSNAAGPAGSGGPLSLTSVGGDIRLGEALAYAFAPSGQPAGSGGDINLAAPAGSVTVSGGFFSALRTDSIGSGTGQAAGDVTVNAATGITLGAAVQANINGPAGNGGNISLTSAGGDIRTTNLLASTAFSGLVGNGGTVLLEAQNGDISTGEISTFANSFFLNNDSGNGGGITLRALGGGITTGPLNAYTEARGAQGDTGNGGAIELIAASGSITATGDVQSYALAAVNNGNSGLAGSGGPIAMQASQNISVSGNLRSYSEAQIFGGQGGTAANGGGLVLTATTGSISLGGAVATYARAFAEAGSGGPISLSANSGIFNSGAGTFDAFAFSQDGSVSNGGSVSLTTTSGNLRLQQVNSSASNTFGSGPGGSGGDITLTTGAGSVVVIGTLFSALDASASSIETAGPAGDVTVSATQGITISGVIRAGGFGTNVDGGDISLTTSQGNITTTELQSLSSNNDDAVGNAGDISLQALAGGITTGNVLAYANALFINNDSGDGGDITLRALGGAVTAGSLQAYTEARGAQGDTGDAGAITVVAANGSIVGTGDWRADALSAINNSGSGAAGSGNNINVQASGSISLTGGLRTASAAVNPSTNQPSPVGSASDAGAVDLTAGNDIILSYLDARSVSPTTLGSGGTVQISTAQFFRATGTIFGTADTISAVGQPTTGAITITHGGGGLTPFSVGNAATNGVSGSLTTAEASLSPSQSFLFSHFEPPNIWILSVTPTLVINELMPNPTVTGDGQGEWLELYNPGSGPVDLNGCVLRDDGIDLHQIDNGGPLLIAPGQYLVLGNNADLITNGGVALAYQYDNLILANDGDELVLECGGLELDRVSYDDGTTFPSVPGRSLQLRAPPLDNSLAANWCAASSAWPGSAGDFGTPGGPTICLTLTKRAAPVIDVPRLSNVIYRLLLTNESGLLASGLALTDTLPSSVDFSQWLAQPAGAAVVADQVTWRGDLPGGQTLTLEFEVTHTGPFEDEVVNVAEYAYLGHSGSATATFVVEPEPFEGVVVINEIMKNPGAVTDANGEWLELYNPGPATVDIDGCLLRDDGADLHRIDNGGPLLIEAGGYLVLGLNADPTANGNVPVAYDYDFYFLANDADEVTFECGGDVIDRVAYNDLTFPDLTGASMQLVAPTVDNNLGSNWCESIFPWPGSPGDLGTPGAVNSCPTDLVLTKTVAEPTAVPGQSVVYTLVYSNSGPGVAGAVITDVMPAGLTNLSFSSSDSRVTLISGTTFVWTVPELLPGGSGVLTVTGVVSADLVAGSGFTNTASIATQADTNPANDAAEAPVTLTEPLPAIPTLVYLPLVSKSPPPPPPAPVTPPDLVVEQLLATTNAITVVIKNSGSEPVVDAFWVDLYLDPASPPTGVNQTWQTLGEQGVAWGIVAPGLPLESQALLTLTLTSPYLIEAETSYTLPLTPGTPVWAQVDSINLNTDYGGVLESHEINGGVYNNISSTLIISAPVVTIPPLLSAQGETVPPPGLPDRE